MIGAPALAARAALRAGAGLVRLAMPGPILAAGIVLTPSATGVRLKVDGRGELVAHEASAAIDRLVTGATCLVIGVGLGQGPGASSASLRAVQQESIPV